jgi:hypothetical protein
LNWWKYSELLGFWTFFIVRYSRKYKHDVSETGSVSVRRWGGRLRLVLSKGPNWVGVFCHPHLRTETHPVSETSCLYSLEYRTMEKVQNPAILCAIHHRQNPLELLGEVPASNMNRNFRNPELFHNFPQYLQLKRDGTSIKPRPLPSKFLSESSTIWPLDAIKSSYWKRRWISLARGKIPVNTNAEIPQIFPLSAETDGGLCFLHSSSQTLDKSRPPKRHYLVHSMPYIGKTIGQGIGFTCSMWGYEAFCIVGYNAV